MLLHAFYKHVFVSLCVKGRFFILEEYLRHIKVCWNCVLVSCLSPLTHPPTSTLQSDACKQIWPNASRASQRSRKTSNNIHGSVLHRRVTGGAGESKAPDRQAATHSDRRDSEKPDQAKAPERRIRTYTARFGTGNTGKPKPQTEEYQHTWLRCTQNYLI